MVFPPCDFRSRRMNRVLVDENTTKGGTASEEDHARKAPKFWARYISPTQTQSVKPPADRWHVRHAEPLVKAFPDLELSGHTPESVSDYLEIAGRGPARKDWPFRQTVVVIRILFGILKPEWLTGFDWDFWRDSSRK